MEIIKVKINDIKPFKGNAKKHPKEQIEQIKKSILEFGMNDPIAIDENNIIIEGHGRLYALKELKYEDVECIRLSHLTEKQKRAYILAHNKLTLNTGFDMDILAGELNFIKCSELDISLTGFNAVELDELFSNSSDSNIQEDDFDVGKAVEEIQEPVSKRGDIWLLGAHKLMCGDSTIAADVEKLMDGKKAKLIVTDAPYNVNFGSSNHPSWKKRSIINDNMSREQFKEFLLKVFTNAYNAVEPGSAIFAFMSAQEWPTIDFTLREIGWHWSSTIIWVKDTMVLGRKSWQPRYEAIWFGWPEGTKMLYPLKEDRTQTDVWEFKRPKKSPLHPTQKSLELIAKPINFCSRKGDIVLDLFSGSASTMISADQLGRICYAAEIDEKYVDVGVARYIQYKGGSDDVFLVRDGVKTFFKDI